MRTTFLALLLAVAPPMAAAQTNTTGTLSPNTTVTQAQSPAAPTTTPTPGATTTPQGATGTTPPAAVATPRDAAIIICGQEFSTGTARLLVFSASTNAGAPTIPPGAPCAQALSDLLVAGFGIIDVLPFGTQLQYTLVR
jgi:hypothetical protein